MEIRDWFSGLSPELRQEWMTARKTGVVSAELVATLPAGHRPYDADPWVLITKGGWTAGGGPTLDRQMGKALEDFLDAEFGRASTAGPDSEPPPAPDG